MSKQTRQDRAFKRFVREHPCVVAVAARTGHYNTPHGALCSGPVEFAHLDHAGMGGKQVPTIGNGFPACAHHHRDIQAGFHGLGVHSFQRHYRIPLLDVCLRLAQWFQLGVPFVDERPVPGLSLMSHPGGT